MAVSCHRLTPRPLLFALLLLCTALSSRAAGILRKEPVEGTTIAFSSFHGRQVYGFELFSVPVPPHLAPGSSQRSAATTGQAGSETRHTLGNTVSYNGHFVPAGALLAPPMNVSAAALQSPGDDGEAAPRRQLSAPPADAATGGGDFGLLFSSEREGGIAQLFYARAAGLAPPVRLTDGIGHHDRPVAVPGQERVVFAGTFDCTTDHLRQSCTRTYSLDLRTGRLKKLTTPPLTAEYSPAVSPCGRWVAVASMNSTMMPAEHVTVDQLRPDQDFFLPTSIVVYRSSDGSGRRVVATQAGWPTWSADGRSIFFHRKVGLALVGDWGIYRADVSALLASPRCPAPPPPPVARVTPPGFEVFTPAAAPNGRFLAVGTRRGPSRLRRVELFDLATGEFAPVAADVVPRQTIYNPFVSPDSSRVGYHRCLCSSPGEVRKVPLVQELRSPVPGVSLLRTANDFPSFSYDAKWLGLTRIMPVPGVIVLGMDFAEPVWVHRGGAFGLNWNPTRNTLYTTNGGFFQPLTLDLPIIAIDVPANVSAPAGGGGGAVAAGIRIRNLTRAHTANNAFPSVSPDGRRMVFRSGRTGYKNLYIMDAEGGELGRRGRLSRLTDGPWTDTMPVWSPTGEWIAFSSNREKASVYSAYLVRPDGTGLRRVLRTGENFGRVVHLHFSPDGRHLVFCTDWSSYAGEPIGTPPQYQAYGQIFAMDVDGSSVRRLTVNPWESGVPTWAAGYVTTGAPDGRTEYGEEIACTAF